RTSERSRAGVRAHFSCTAHAASRAALASSLVAEARVAIVSPVAGFSTSKVPPSEASRQESPINRPFGTFPRMWATLASLPVVDVVVSVVLIRLPSHIDAVGNLVTDPGELVSSQWSPTEIRSKVSSKKLL